VALTIELQLLQIDPGPERKEFSGQVAGWSFRDRKPWQAGNDLFSFLSLHDKDPTENSVSDQRV